MPEGLCEVNYQLRHTLMTAIAIPIFVNLGLNDSQNIAHCLFWRFTQCVNRLRSKQLVRGMSDQIGVNRVILLETR